MELLQLRYFVALAETQNVGHTAQALGVSQSSLSKTLQRLEDDLGASLFDRVGRNIRLHDGGRRFLARARRALRELDEGRTELVGGGEVDQVRLVVTTASLLPEVLKAFRADRPQARFHVRMVDEAEVEPLLRSGTVDFALSTEPVHDADLGQRRLVDDPVWLAVPSGHRLASRTSVGLSDLADEEFVGLKAGLRKRDALDDFCRLSGLVPRYVYEGDEPARIASLVEAGLGVAFVPSTSRKDSSAVTFLPIDQGPHRTLWLQWPRGRAWRETAQAFRALLDRLFPGPPA